MVKNQNQFLPQHDSDLRIIRIIYITRVIHIIHITQAIHNQVLHIIFTEKAP